MMAPFLGYITHRVLKHTHPKYTKTITYTIDGSTLMILSRDTHLNPGLLATILQGLPNKFHQRQKQYFLPNTTKLNPHYSHLIDLFDPYLNHNNHLPITRPLKHLLRHIILPTSYPHTIDYLHSSQQSTPPHIFVIETSPQT